ncbi:MAG: ribose-phosphate diphosphokinase [Myxococcaceae bacterium]
MKNVTLLSGTGNRPLAAAIGKELGLPLAPCLLERFPDGEMHIELREEVRGRDVYLVQPTRDPVGELLLELMLLADACRRSGAGRVTAVIPYVGYARQDRRESGFEPVGAKVMADIVSSGSIDRVVAMDLHSRGVEGCFKVPVEHVSAVDLLAGRLKPLAHRHGVVVSPDLGAVKLAERYARLLDLPVAVVHKVRLGGADVAARGVMGEVKGRSPIVVDDMISTAGTIVAAIEALRHAGCADDISVAATHALLVGPAVERLKPLPIARLVTTDSVPPPSGLPLPIELVSVAPVLADAVRRLSGS